VAVGPVVLICCGMLQWILNASGATLMDSGDFFSAQVYFDKALNEHIESFHRIFELYMITGRFIVMKKMLMYIKTFLTRIRR
jgi:hypothetical protein